MDRIKKIIECQTETEDQNVFKFLNLLNNIKATSQWEYLKLTNNEAMNLRSELVFLKNSIKKNLSIINKLVEIESEEIEEDFI